MPNYQSNLDDVFKALSDPTRRAVIQQLSLGPATVKELAEPFDMALPSIMQHLSILEKSHLIRSHKTGRVRTCEIQPQEMAALEDWVASLRATWEARLDRLDNYISELQSDKESK